MLRSLRPLAARDAGAWRFGDVAVIGGGRRHGCACFPRLIAARTRSGSAVQTKGFGSPLRVVDPPNSVLAEKKGSLPLRLKATLNGEVQIQVSRDASPKAFRGFYQVEVTPPGGVGQRLLRPTESVEQ